MRNFLYAMIASLLIILMARPANACFSMAALVIDDIKYASVVVIGRIVDYEIVPNYARFNVLVDEVLVGQPPHVISVTWGNSTFGLPKKMKEGPYLIGLRAPDSESPPLRGPSATVLPSQEPESLTVLQASCAPAFIFDASSAEAKEIREKLSTPPE